jgi:hypothetical protein
MKQREVVIIGKFLWGLGMGRGKGGVKMVIV